MIQVIVVALWSGIFPLLPKICYTAVGASATMPYFYQNLVTKQWAMILSERAKLSGLDKHGRVLALVFAARSPLKPELG